ncbi:MAG TPA: thiamine pyrophosphate-dependent enzyme [Polyangiaceae bacterium]|nr:thiamine pyrophosphate-dependent enzyme [Polyangiaceae bacterium]
MTSAEPKLLQELYRHTVRLRRVDERLLGLQRQGRIGFYGPASGQEAVAVGAGLALENRDWVFQALRESGVMLVRGYALSAYVAQLFGNELDPMKGRQMPSHMASRAVKQVSWSSCIATQLPHAVGAARAMQLAGDRAVALAFMGDGATSSPDFHAALNFAGIWRAPVVFVCQNNGYAISVPTTRQTASESFAIKARAYGFDGETIDGNDALVVHDAVQRALARARAGDGPTLIECLTYRLGPHSTSDDPTRYRPAGEIERWLERFVEGTCLGEPPAEHHDGIALEPRWLREVDEELDLAIQSSESAARPALSTLFDDVYAERPWHLAEQRQSLA